MRIVIVACVELNRDAAASYRLNHPGVFVHEGTVDSFNERIRLLTARAAESRRRARHGPRGSIASSRQKPRSFCASALLPRFTLIFPLCALDIVVFVVLQGVREQAEKHLDDSDSDWEGEAPDYEVDEARRRANAEPHCPRLSSSFNFQKIRS